MAFDNILEQRVEDYLIANNISYEIKHMFGGSAFMVNDKMCVGIIKDHLMARVDPNRTDDFLQKPFVEMMKMGQRTMKGYLSIHPDGIVDDRQLAYWVDVSLEYNPIAKRSKKKK